jgi:hypothetical protein
VRKETDSLTDHERALIAQAKKDLQDWVRVDFVYGQGVDSIHKMKQEYDMFCMSRGIPVPIVDIVDYTGHIARLSPGDKMYEQLRNAYASRKDYMLSAGKIGFDFAQVNREGNKRLNEEKPLTMADLAGSYDLSQVCDNIISINRSDLLRESNQALLHVTKSRDGQVGDSYTVKTRFDIARYDMEDIREERVQK